ncbi:MAG TPA: hypothetical protein VII67_03240 [Acidimicrobiales bacterium]
MSTIKFTPKYRKFSYKTDENGITTVSGELVNMDELLTALVEALVKDGRLAEIVGVQTIADLMEHMTPEELTAILERFVPPPVG